MSLVKEVAQLSDVRDEARDRELIRDLDELFKRAKDDRQQHESQWLTNLAFYLDQQWLFYNETSRKLERPRVPRWRVLMVLNLIKGQVLTKYAKLVQSRPQAHAQPRSDDPDDRAQAEVCDSILDYLWVEDGSEGAVKRALMWALITGTGILKTYWNKSAGPVLTYPDTTLVVEPDPVTGEPVQVEVPHPKAGEAVTDQAGEAVHLGEVETCEVSPLEFYPDPHGLTINDKSWCFVQKLRSPEYVMERYGVEVEAQEIAADDLIEGQLMLLAPNALPKKGVVVREFTQRPTRKYPEGRFVVYVANKVLHEGANPYPKCPLPFAAFVDLPVPGRFWGESIVTAMIDPQKNLNKSRSQAIEIRNLMAKPKVIVYKNALDVGKTITSAPGEIIEVNPIQGVANPVEFVQGQPIPDSFWKDIERSVAELREVSMIHEVSNAGVPSGVSAARAIGFLQEQDDLRLGPTAQAYEDAISQVSTYKLRLARQFYDEPRTVRIVGKDKQTKVVEFRKEDIPDDVDVRVETGSALPKSRVARQNFILELWEKGLVKDPRVAVRMLEIGDIEGLYDDVNRDIAQAERENEAMKAAEPRAANDFDNHVLHIAEHNKFRKGEEYERLDEAAKAAFVAHVAQHQQYATTMAPPSPTPPGAIAGGAAGVSEAQTAQPPDLAALLGAPTGPAEGSPLAFTQ